MLGIEKEHIKHVVQHQDKMTDFDEEVRQFKYLYSHGRMFDSEEAERCITIVNQQGNRFFVGSQRKLSLKYYDIYIRRGNFDKFSISNKCSINAHLSDKYLKMPDVCVCTGTRKAAFVQLRETSHLSIFSIFRHEIKSETRSINSNYNFRVGRVYPFLFPSFGVCS